MNRDYPWWVLILLNGISIGLGIAGLLIRLVWL